MNAAEIPEKLRAFVAIFPPETVVAQLKTVQAQLENVLKSNAVRWTKSEQIHLTLQFLGYIERKQLADFQSVMEIAVQKHHAFHLRSETIGCFPNQRRPRIIWAGLAGGLDCLESLKEELDAAFSNLGYMPEKRIFHPHFTIGRVSELTPKDAARLAEEISKLGAEMFGEWKVQKVHLMQSVLSPKGATYQVLKLFPLEDN